MINPAYDPIDMHKKKSSALVVHCSDPRFQDAYRRTIDNMGLYYDLLVFPGASKTIADNKLVVDNIALLHSLHGFEQIHILDHTECGAFGQIDDEVTAHSDYMKKATVALGEALPNVEVIGHLLGEKGELDLSN
jgi:hypothetical protein